MQDNTCTCGNDGCAKRVRLGLTPFCQIKSTYKPEPNLYPSYRAAIAASPVGKERLVSSCFLTGTPTRFESVQ